MVQKIHSLKPLSVAYGVTRLMVSDKEVMIMRGVLATETASGGDGFNVLVRENNNWQFAQLEIDKPRQITLWSAPHTGEDVITSLRFLIPKEGTKEAATALYVLNAHRDYKESPLDLVPVKFTLYELRRDDDFGIYYLSQIASEITRNSYSNSDTAIYKELGIAPPSEAQELPSQAEESCLEAAMTQSEMNECSFKDAKRAEIKLDETYNRLLKQTSHENRHKLKEARRAWTEYRKLQCEFDTLGSSTGSVHPMVVNLCYEGQTIEYTKLLEQQLNCEEGNLSCGGQ